MTTAISDASSIVYNLCSDLRHRLADREAALQGGDGTLNIDADIINMIDALAMASFRLRKLIKAAGGDNVASVRL